MSCVLDERTSAINPDLFHQPNKIAIKLPSGERKEFRGRTAWMLRKLIDAGGSGVTTHALPAGLRISHYVHQLRLAGVNVRTEYEKHGGEFAGKHARYALASMIEVLR